MRESKNKKSYFSKEAWQYYFSFFHGLYRKLIITSIVATAQAALIIPILLLVRYIFDVAIPEKKVQVLIMIGLAIIGIRLINMSITLILRKVNIKIVTKAIYRLRDDLMTRIYTFSRSLYTREDQRILHARIVQDTERIMRMSNTLISGLIPSILISIGLSAILMIFNWFLFVVILLFFPVIFFSNRYMGKKLKKRVFAFQRSFENFSKSVMFILKFLDLIKIQSAEKLEEEKQRKVLKELEDNTARQIYFNSINSQLQTFLVSVSGILVIVIGGISVIKDFMTIGDFFAFYIAANHLQTSLNSINNSFTKILIGNESLITLQNIVEDSNTEPYNGKTKVDFNKSIILQSVAFKYTDKPVLRNLSLQVPSGSRIAIIGPNGAGKSTIIHLILGFYTPQFGNIVVDGIDFSEIDFHYFRQQVGVVSQHPLLFPGSIMENLRYGNEHVSEEDIISVSKVSLAHDFIKKLENGYESQIGEDGVLLSGGERQKIAITRALLRRPKLLILDEPTNHLDNSAVKTIMQNLDIIEYKPAIIIISHDKIVANYADKIYLLEDGELHQIQIN